jgi:Periplasmic copper-binding protein (NosD)
VFGASGSSHAAGDVPDPGSSAGTTKFLREDATWQTLYTNGGVNEQSGTSYTIVTGDRSKLVNFNNTSAVAVAVTASSTLTNTFFCWLENLGAGVVTITPDGSETIDGASSLTLDQNQGLILFSDGSNLFTSRGLGATGSFTAGGDLSGTSSSQTVVGLSGKALDSATVGSPSDGDVITYDNASGKYKAAAPSGGSSLPTATEGGQIISSTAAGTTYDVQPQIFYSQSGDTISSIETECAVAAPSTYVVTIPQTITLTADHTLSADVLLEFKAGGVWTIDGAGFTLTIPTGIRGDLSQHFVIGTGSLKLTGTPNVPAEWFGAVGDGSTDDATAIQNTINALQGTGAAGSNDGHGNVLLQAKTYKIGTGLTITHGGVSIIGVNSAAISSPGYSSVITTASASLNILSITGTSGSYITNNYVKQVTLERSVQPTGTATALSVQYTYRTVVDQVLIFDSIRGVYIANVGAGGTGAFENIQVYYAVSGSGTYYGFYVDETGSNTTPSLRVRNCTVGKGSASGTTYGFYATGGHIWDIHVTHFETAQMSYGIYLNSTSSPTFENTDVFFDNCVLDSCTTSAVYITGMTTTGSSAVLFSNCYFNATGSSPTVDIESSNGISVQGCMIGTVFGVQAQVYVNGGGSNTISGNVFMPVQASAKAIVLNSTSYNAVNDNTIRGDSATSTYGIQLTSASDNIITGNALTGSLAVGLSFDSSSNNNIAYPNVLNSGSITTPISDSGSGNVTSGAGAGVASLDSLTGALTLVGNGITIADNTPSAGDIQLTASDYVVMSDGANPPNPMDDGAGNFLYVGYSV